VTGQNHLRLVNENGGGEADVADHVGELLNLFLRVRSGVLRMGCETCHGHHAVKAFHGGIPSSRESEDGHDVVAKRERSRGSNMATGFNVCS